MFGSKVQKIREDKGITRSFICKKMGKHARWLYEIEVGRVKKINPLDLEILASLIGVKVSDFFDKKVC